MCVRACGKSKLKNKNYIIIFILLGTFSILSAADNIIDMTVCEWYIWALVAIVTAKVNKRSLHENEESDLNIL